MAEDYDATERLLEKLRTFVADELDEEERQLFALLVAPAVAGAHREDEVAGFGVTGWRPAAVPERLAAALRHGGLMRPDGD